MPNKQHFLAGAAQVGSQTLTQEGVGAQQLGSTWQHFGAGAQQVGSAVHAWGAQQVGSTTQHFGAGAQQLGSSQQTGAGAQQLASFLQKQSNKPASAELTLHNSIAAERVIHFILSQLLEGF